MTKKKTKKLISIRLNPDQLSDIKDMCEKTSMISRTELIEKACRILLDNDDEDTPQRR